MGTCDECEWQHADDQVTMSISLRYSSLFSEAASTLKVVHADLEMHWLRKLQVASYISSKTCLNKHPVWQFASESSLGMVKHGN